MRNGHRVGAIFYSWPDILSWCPTTLSRHQRYNNKQQQQQQQQQTNK